MLPNSGPVPESATVPVAAVQGGGINSSRSEAEQQVQAGQGPVLYKSPAQALAAALAAAGTNLQGQALEGPASNTRVEL